MAYITDATRWRALTMRDAKANGHFVYSVKSTNIYCRPMCPARLARRANVNFYKTPFDAEADGFRACKRCKPNALFEDPQERAVAKACMLIDQGVKNNDAKASRLQDLAKSVCLTPRYFHKIFKDRTGLTPREWAKTRSISQSSSTASPVTTIDPAGHMDTETVNWESFSFNDFSDLVDFDVGEKTTSGYNLATDISESVSMSHGNTIDTAIAYETWTRGHESGENNTRNVCGDMSAASMLWPTEEKAMPVTSNFELDLDAILRCDGVLF